MLRRDEKMKDYARRVMVHSTLRLYVEDDETVVLVGPEDARSKWLMIQEKFGNRPVRHSLGVYSVDFSYTLSGKPLTVLMADSIDEYLLAQGEEWQVWDAATGVRLETVEEDEEDEEDEAAPAQPFIARFSGVSVSEAVPLAWDTAKTACDNGLDALKAAGKTPTGSPQVLIDGPAFRGTYSYMYRTVKGVCVPNGWTDADAGITDCSARFWNASDAIAKASFKLLRGEDWAIEAMKAVKAAGLMPESPWAGRLYDFDGPGVAVPIAVLSANGHTHTFPKAFAGDDAWVNRFAERATGAKPGETIRMLVNGGPLRTRVVPGGTKTWYVESSAVKTTAPAEATDGELFTLAKAAIESERKTTWNLPNLWLYAPKADGTIDQCAAARRVVKPDAV